MPVGQPPAPLVCVGGSPSGWCGNERRDRGPARGSQKTDAEIGGPKPPGALDDLTVGWSGA